MASQTFTAAQVLTAAQMNTLANTVDGYATTATAAGTTTLTVASYYQQFFTGTTTQTVVMPVASTLVVGWKIRVVNNSSGVVTVQSSGANTIYAVPAGGDVIFTCILASGTTAASWDYKNATLGGSAGMTLIKRASYSGVATTGTTFDSVFSSTYKQYLIVIETHYAATSTDACHLQFRYSATTVSTAYYSASRALDQAGTLTSTSVTNGAQCTIHYNSGSSTAPLTASLTVSTIGNGSSKPMLYGNGFTAMGNPATWFNGGFTDTAQSYDGFLLKSASTNITGTVSVYGLAAA